jgi:flagellar assembly protein FliH
MASFVSLLAPPKPLSLPPLPVVLPPPVDLDAVRAAARAEGRAEAEAEAEAEVRAARAGMAVLPDLVDALTRGRREALDHAAHDVVALLSAALHKSLGDHLVHRPEVLLRIVLDAMARIEGEEGVSIRVPPEAVDFVRAGLPERHQSSVRADSMLTAGVVVEATHVTIESSVQTMVTGLDEAMRAWLEGRS